MTRPTLLETKLGLLMPVSLFVGLWLVSFATTRLIGSDTHDKFVVVLALVLAFA